MFTRSLGPPEEGRKGWISRCSGPPKQGREERDFKIFMWSMCPPEEGRNEGLDFSLFRST